MPDPRSAMKEYRSLDAKRKAGRLSPDEEARYAVLRDLVAPGAAATDTQGGFDVGAAAAKLRESLLPAGLRNRPPPIDPAPPPEAARPAFDPFAPLPGEVGDAELDATLGAAPAEQPYDAGAGWDPNAPPAAPDAAGYGDAASPYDPNAPAWDPNASPYDPNAPGDEAAQAQYDPNAPAWDPNAPPYDPNAPGYEGAQAPYDPNAPLPDAYDPDATHEPSAGYDAAAQYDPDVPAADAFDPNAPLAEGLDSGTAGVPADAAYEPGAPEPAGWDGEPVMPEAPEAGAPAYAGEGEGAELQPPEAGAPWDGVEGALAEPGEAPPVFDADLAEPASPEWSSGASVPSPVPARPFGEYDEDAAAAPAAPDQSLAPMLPFDAASAAAIEPGAVPEGFAPPLGDYDDTPDFAARGGDATPADLPQEPDESGFCAAQELSGEVAQDWQPDAVMEDGFTLESGGSFDGGAEAVAPESEEAAPAPAEWEAAPEPAAEPAEPGEDLGSAAQEEAAPAPEPLLSDLLEPAPIEEAGESPSPEAGEAAPEDAGAIAAPAEVPAPAEEAPEAFAEAEPFVPELEAAPAEPAEGSLGGDAAAPDAGALSAESPAEPADLDFAVDVEAPENLSAPAPELDFSRPNLSGDTEEPGDGELPSFDISLDEEPAPAAAASPARPAGAIPAGLEVPGAGPSPRDAPGSAEAGLARPPQEDDLPTIDGEEILEEIPPERAVAPSAATAAAPPLAPAAPAQAPPQVAAPPKQAAPTAAAPSPFAPPPPPAASPAAPAQAAAVTPAAVPAAPPKAAAPVEYRIAGVHRVVVHTVEGQVKRGVLENADLDAAKLDLGAQLGTKAETIATEKVKAIFFMLAPGETAPTPHGKKVRVTFRDGRQIAGFSPDYSDEGAGFFMVPGDTKTNTGRIWVYRAAVRQVTVS